MMVQKQILLQLTNLANAYGFIWAPNMLGSVIRVLLFTLMITCGQVKYFEYFLKEKLLYLGK